MFADSIYVLVLGILIGVPTLIFLFIGLYKGYFENLESCSLSIFDDEELRHSRPWEDDLQKIERTHLYGASVEPPHEYSQRWL